MKGAKRAIAVDVTGLPLAARVLPALVHDNEGTRMLLADMTGLGQSDRLQLVLVDRGVTEPAAKQLTRLSGVTVKRVGWDDKQLDEKGKAVFRPIRHAWRVEVAHGELVGPAGSPRVSRTPPTQRPAGSNSHARISTPHPEQSAGEATSETEAVEGQDAAPQGRPLAA